MKRHLLVFLAASCFPSLSSAQLSNERLEEAVFGRMPDGTTVERFSSGRVMEVRTDRPAVQLYTDNPVGFCLETQNYPDAINHENSPSPILRPGTPYQTAPEAKSNIAYSSPVLLCDGIC